MQDFLQALDYECAENVLQFHSTYIGDSESYHGLEYQFCRSLEENVGEDSVLVSKRY